MKTIYKYYLKDEKSTIALPIGSKVVCVNEQSDRPTIWVEQDTNYPPIEFNFFVVPTGAEIPPNTFFVGTCFIDRYVFHIYQQI